MLREVVVAVLLCNLLCTMCCDHALALFGVSDEVPEGAWKSPVAARNDWLVHDWQSSLRSTDPR